MHSTVVSESTIYVFNICGCCFNFYVKIIDFPGLNAMVNVSKMKPTLMLPSNFDNPLHALMKFKLLLSGTGKFKFAVKHFIGNHLMHMANEAYFFS